MPLGRYGPRPTDVDVSDLAEILADTEELILEQQHDTRIFPESTALTCTLTAHANANTWSAWAEIQDSGATTFSSLVTIHTHVSSILVEHASATDKLYLIQLSYGGARISLTRLRFISGERIFLPPLQQMRIRTINIPKGEKVYYRMMSETGGATCRISLRYHYHQ